MLLRTSPFVSPEILLITCFSAQNARAFVSSRSAFVPAFKQDLALRTSLPVGDVPANTWSPIRRCPAYQLSNAPAPPTVATFRPATAAVSVLCRSSKALTAAAAAAPNAEAVAAKGPKDRTLVASGTWDDAQKHRQVPKRVVMWGLGRK